MITPCAAAGGRTVRRGCAKRAAAAICSNLEWSIHIWPRFSDMQLCRNRGCTATQRGRGHIEPAVLHKASIAGKRPPRVAKGQQGWQDHDCTTQLRKLSASHVYIQHKLIYLVDARAGLQRTGGNHRSDPINPHCTHQRECIAKRASCGSSSHARSGRWAAAFAGGGGDNMW